VRIQVYFRSSFGIIESRLECQLNVFDFGKFLLFYFPFFCADETFETLVDQITIDINEVVFRIQNKVSVY
jgi:hypothetical protein